VAPGHGAGCRGVARGMARAVAPGHGAGAWRRGMAPGHGAGAWRRGVAPGRGAGAWRRGMAPGRGAGCRAAGLRADTARRGTRRESSTTIADEAWRLQRARSCARSSERSSGPRPTGQRLVERVRRSSTAPGGKSLETGGTSDLAPRRAVRTRRRALPEPPNCRPGPPTRADAHRHGAKTARETTNPRYLPKGARVGVAKGAFVMSCRRLSFGRPRSLEMIEGARPEVLLRCAGARRGDDPGDHQNCEADECGCDHFVAPSAEPTELAIPFTDWKSM
jgi:hypothetical protein